jgi:hypothetical protein
MSVDNVEVADATENNPMSAFTEAAEEVSAPNAKYTTEDIAKARAQEKEKLYPVVDKLKEELALLKQKEAEREAKEAERKAARVARDAEAAAAKKKQEEEELEVRSLLQIKEQEWQSKFEQERAEREKAFALLEREREFQELTTYRQNRIEQERESIIPTLIDLVQGSTKDEIEQSILALKAKSAQIFEDVAAASQNSRKEMVGTRITVPASGPLDNDSASGSFNPNDISNMSLADYAKNREKLLGMTGKNRGQGLFGNN